MMERQMVPVMDAVNLVSSFLDGSGIAGTVRSSFAGTVRSPIAWLARAGFETGLGGPPVRLGLG